MSSSLELLERFKPHLIYDTQESYFADSAAEWTDAAGNVLVRGDRKTAIAAAVPKAGQAQLSLALLSGGPYGSTGEAYEKGDVISCPAKDYVAIYRDLRVLPGYRNIVYGRTVYERRRPRWLQYWLFYFYNPAPAKNLGVGYGAHEGDWEMIQLRLGTDARPDLAVYCQHKNAEVRGWGDVQKTGSGDTPVVYVARASHASYFGRVHLPWERADGGLPAPPLVLEELADQAPSWAQWRGGWGDTHPEEIIGIEIGESSPGGPVTHKQWRTPATLLKLPAQLAPRVMLKPMPPAPEALSVRRRGRRAEVSFAFAGRHAGSATGLLITVSSPDDRYPPVTDTVPIESGSGKVLAPTELDPVQRYVVHVSAVNDQGATSAVLSRNLFPRR